MNLNAPGPLDRRLRIGRLEDSSREQGTDGPLALLRSVSSLAWRHKARLVTCLAAGTIIAAVYAQSLPFSYTATATLLLEPRKLLFTGQDLGAQSSLDMNSAESELQIIRSERLLTNVFDSLNLADEPELKPQTPRSFEAAWLFFRDRLRAAVTNNAMTLNRIIGAYHEPRQTLGRPEAIARRVAFTNFISRLRARRVGQSYVIEIEYASSSPALAARVANAIASGYILQSVAFKEEMARAGTETLRGRLDALKAQVDASRAAMERGELPATATPDADARIVGAALPPLGPSSPRVMVIITLGSLLGLVCGMLTVAWSAAFNRKVQTAGELLRETALPVIAVVPDARHRWLRGWKTDYRSNEKFLSAIRDLLISADLFCSERSGRGYTIALVGPKQGVGVSTLSLWVAGTINRGKKRVALFQNITDDKNVPSPTEMLLFDDAMPNNAANDLSCLDSISVFPIQSNDPRASIYADLRRPRILELIDKAKTQGEVILDLPALDKSLEALPLALQADAVLLVVLANSTRFEEVNEAAVLLRRAGANLVGVVLNRAAR